uniref:NTR domain-containing protein n=1 Tax=Theropithecus gelada TaxID=9565 RepID=A0A8D2FDU5_THEGE
MFMPQSVPFVSLARTMDPSFLLSFSLLLTLLPPCNACLCKLLHPQTVYCETDVGESRETPGKSTKERVSPLGCRTILKAPKGTSEIRYIYTPRREEDCGYTVVNSHQSQLLIAGYLSRGKVYFTRCHLFYFWYRLTPHQQLGFQSVYNAGCDCQILPCLLCWRNCPEPDVTDCTWKQANCEYSIWQGDESLFSTCVPLTSGRCGWTRISLRPSNTTSPNSLLTTIPPSSSLTPLP